MIAVDGESPALDQLTKPPEHLELFGKKTGSRNPKESDFLLEELASSRPIELNARPLQINLMVSKCCQ
jgi:hypothetical protein